MKISRARLKQIIKEELEEAYTSPGPVMGKDHNLIYLIKQHRKTWLNREWNDEVIEEDPAAAYSELMYSVGNFWNSRPVKQIYTGQESELNAALSVIKKVVDRAERGKLRTAYKDIDLVTPTKKSPSALAGTPLGKRVGLIGAGIEVNPFPDEDDDL